MPIGIASDFIIYPEQFFSGVVEVLQTNFSLFNDAVGNTIRLITEAHIGDYTKKSFVKHTDGLIQERNNLSNNDVDAKILTHGEYADIKVNRRIGPAEWTLDEFAKLGEDPELASFELGQMMGPQIAQDYAKAALASVGAAIQSNSSLLFDKTGLSTTTIETPDFVDAIRPFGDASSRIKVWVMHSKPFFDLVKGQYLEKLYDMSVAVVYGGSPATFGRPVIVSDIDSLVNRVAGSAAQTTYNIYGLVEDAVVVKESEGRKIVNQLKTGKENLFQRLQGEYAFNVGVKGCGYRLAAGNNPSLATLANKINWAAYNTVTDAIKLMPGVAMKVK